MPNVGATASSSGLPTTELNQLLATIVQTALCAPALKTDQWIVQGPGRYHSLTTDVTVDLQVEAPHFFKRPPHISIYIYIIYN